LSVGTPVRAFAFGCDSLDVEVPWLAMAVLAAFHGHGPESRANSAIDTAHPPEWPRLGVRQRPGVLSRPDATVQRSTAP
jgi:hypothetical protein